MRLIQTKSIILIVLLICFFGTGCSHEENKPSDSAELKTLDNLAAGKDIIQNTCGSKGAYVEGLPQPNVARAQPVFGIIRGDKTVPPKELSSLKVETALALSGLPKSLQLAFSKIETSSIVLTKAIETHCKANAELGVSTCYVVEENDGKVSPTIYLSAEVDKIQHGGVRVFGYLFASVFSRYGIVANGSSLEKIQLSPTWQDKKQALAQTFIQESKAELSLDDGSPLVADSVLAEAMDSYYCDVWSSKNTRASFKKSFPKTFSKFEPIIQDILGYTRSVHPEKSPTSLSLQMPWSGGGYQYYPSYGGNSYGQSAGMGQYGAETYGGSYVNQSTGNYYNTYNNSSGMSYGGQMGGGMSYSQGFSGAPTATSLAATTGTGGGLDAPNMLGD